MAKLPPATPLAIRVRLADRRQAVRLDHSFSVDRGYDDVKVVEFDAPQGTYLMHVDAPKFGCSATTFQEILPDHVRSIDETLVAGGSLPQMPLLLAGAAPQSFLYVHPTFVALSKQTPCNGPVGDALPSHIDVENDPDAYFAWAYGDLANGQPEQLALQLRTPTHQYHYVRLPITFPVPPSAFPSVVTFDVTQDEIDSLASQPVDTLLCLHLWETKVYY
jgi:hypothetical protein